MKYEDLADAMEAALDEKLWDESSGYLMNYNGELLDRHYYMGSLLAAPFGFLSPEKTSKLVATASRILVDDRIGVRTVMPPDFNRDSVRAFFRFVGNEAGDPFLYANGGVWPHANAFYTAALLAVNRPREARRFFETTMTLDGIANSPMGLPAMYEYRYSDPASPQFGKIDKPSFLWAGGFYLSTLYRLMGVTDNEWNISIGGPVAIPFDHTNFRLHFLGDHVVAVRAHGTALSSFLADGTSLPSCVLPLDIGRTGRWELGFGQADRPYLERVNAILSSARFDSNARRLTCTLSSFAGHRVSARIVVRGSPVRILLDGKTLAVPDTVRRPDGMLMFDVRFNGSAEKQTMEIQF
jgi:hypothetical protein